MHRLSALQPMLSLYLMLLPSYLFPDFELKSTPSLTSSMPMTAQILLPMEPNLQQGFFSGTNRSRRFLFNDCIRGLKTGMMVVLVVMG